MSCSLPATHPVPNPPKPPETCTGTQVFTMGGGNLDISTGQSEGGPEKVGVRAQGHTARKSQNPDLTLSALGFETIDVCVTP